MSKKINRPEWVPENADESFTIFITITDRLIGRFEQKLEMYNDL